MNKNSEETAITLRKIEERFEKIITKKQKEFVLDCSEDTIEYYEVSSENTISSRRTKKSMEEFQQDFDNEIKREYTSLAYTDGENIHIYRPACGIWWLNYYKFTLTDSAKKNKELMAYLESLPDKQHYYDKYSKQTKKSYLY